MHFRIAEQRIITFLLQLIVRGSSKRRSKILILRIKQGGVSVPSPHFQARQKGVRRGAFLNFRKGFVGEEKVERLLRRDFPEGDELQHNLSQVDAGALLFGIMRIRHEVLLRNRKILLFLNPFCCVVFQLAFLILGVLLLIQRAHMFVKILRIWKIEINPIGMSLRVQRIIVRIFYIQQTE